jgi:signal transduction histidine kinase
VGTLITIVVSLSAVFATARSSADVAREGTIGIYAEASLSAIAATRNRSIQAMLIVQAADLDLSSQEEARAAVDTAHHGLDELDIRIARLENELEPPARTQLIDQYQQFSADVAQVLEQLEATDRTDRQESLLRMEESYGALAETIAFQRDEVVRALELNRAEAGRIADAARFMVALVVPLAAVFVFRRSVRRRERQTLLMQELERQRQIAHAKDDFIADLSHELRTPLTGINGFAATLLDPSVTAEPTLVKEFSSLIAQEAGDLSRMIDDLLTAARAKDDALSFKLEKVDPKVAVAKIIGPLAAQGLTVHVHLADGYLQADPDRLRQVLRNLVSNAVRHGAPPFAVTGRVSGDRYLLAVADGGPGVPNELESRLFNRYIHEGRAPLLVGSVGLGLAIAQLLARRMGGDLIYRRVDLTTFIVDLPLWVEPDEVPVESKVLLHHRP